MQYLNWNDLLAGYFFKPDLAGKRVHVSVTSSVIEDIGRTSNCDVADFIAAIKVGPPWVTRQGICQKALQALVDWRKRGLPYPPYFGYLSLFVLAAGLEGDFAPHAYYPRLRTLLGEAPETGQYPSFERMLELWDDLEQWANEDLRGELGEFRADIAGGWINVGLPVAQVILTEQERQRLHAIFGDGGLDPTSSPTDEEFAALLIARGHHRLRPRTLQLLQAPTNGNSEVRDILISTALDELREWDGQITSDEGNSAQIYGTLRLCGRLDRVAQRIKLALRCKSRHDIPEEGLILTLEGQNTALRCVGHVMGWSTELTQELDGRTFDPSNIDWTVGTSGRAEELGWRFRLPGSDVRIFEDGSPSSIPGIVEIPRLQRQKSFYIACHSEAAETIERWGRTECHGFIDLGIKAGLPSGWRFFYAGGADGDKLVRMRFPSLSFNSTVRVYFEDGIRSSRNQYFSFGLPELLVDGGDESLSVHSGDAVLAAGSDGRYSIPDSIAKPGRLSIEVKRADSVVTRRSLFVSDEVQAPDNHTFKGDRFGRTFTPRDGEGFVSGAVTSFPSPSYDIVFLPEAANDGRLIFVGRVPGEIAFLGAGERPSGWKPVWVIVMHRKGKAIFCGDDLTDAAPTRGALPDKKRVEDWKHVLWYRRKRIVPPAHDSLHRLWNAYQEEARKL
jgi:hypothetical protein